VIQESGDGKKASQIFLSGTSGSALEHDASEDTKSESKPPPPEPIIESRGVSNKNKNKKVI